MAQLNQFSGGLVTRLDPSLLALTQATVVENVDISKGILSPLKKDKDENITVGKSMVYFKNKWVYSDKDLNYVIYQEKLYQSGDTLAKKSNDGITWYNLGIKGPSIAPSVSVGTTVTNINSTYRYCYTYYNSNDGTESQPSPYSTEISISKVNALVPVSASTDEQVDKIKIYRLGGPYTAMSLVATIPNITTVYSDTISDVNIPADSLVSIYYGQAPIGLKYLTMNNAMFFGAVGDKLYFSEVAYVNAWSPYNYIDFDEPITALGVTPNGLLVCTEYSTYVVTGSSPTTLSKYLLSKAQGCLLHNSMKNLTNACVWLSHDGICGSSGTSIEVITRDKLGKLKFSYPTDAIVYDDVYYLAHEDGTFVLDSRFNGCFYTLDLKADCFVVKNNQLFYGYNNNLFNAFNDNTYRTLKYKTGYITEGSITNRKNYKTFYIYSSGDISMTIHKDGKKFTSLNLISGLNELKVPREDTFGYHISLEFVGTGFVYEVEYKVEGRQNGR